VRARIGLVAAVAALLVLPASAQAAPPANDDYEDASQMNNPGTGLGGTGVTRSTIQAFPNTTEATTQKPGGGATSTEIYPGQPEFDRCQVSTNTWSAYGKTVWYDIHPDVHGDVFIRGAGFDSVIAVIQYRSLADAEPLGGTCYDDPTSPTLEELVHPVRAGGHYSIQVGGWAGFLNNPSNPDPMTPLSGVLDLRVTFLPDRDDDNTYDSQDRCRTAAGPSSLRGCPDSDGDRVPNIDDRCATLRGLPSLGGCPDADGDRLIDPSDRCPRESSAGKTDRNANGCPDYGSIPDLRASIEGVIRGNKVVGVRFRRLGFRSRAPRGTRLRVSCRPKRNCKLRRRGSLRRRIRSHRFRTKRTKITVRATKGGYVGKVFTMTVTFKRVRGGGRNVILRGPTKRCIPVGGRRTRRCTSSLTLR